MKNRWLGNTPLIVNVMVVILIFLKMERYLIIERIFCVKVHFKWKKSIYDGKSLLRMEKVHLKWKKFI